MKNFLLTVSLVVLGAYTPPCFALSSSKPAEPSRLLSLTVSMTNNETANAIYVFDSETHKLLQKLMTGGSGGAQGNARGIRQLGNHLVAVVNSGSKSVSIFERKQSKLVLISEVATTSEPVSIDFGSDHMYVAGATTVDSFRMNGQHVDQRDGTVDLVLAGGGTPAVGATAQVGAMKDELLVTIKADPAPGTVDMISLSAMGAVIGHANPVSAPLKSLTPFGFTVLGPNSALITLAHSNQLGIFQNGTFSSVLSNMGQEAPCWSTRIGNDIFIVNAMSKTISSRIVSKGLITMAKPVAARIITGGNPTDIDSNGSTVAVIDAKTGSGATSHLSFFKIKFSGELTAMGSPIDLQVPTANGVAVLAN